MQILKNISYVCITGFLVNSVAYADIGVRYQDEHRNRNNKSNEVITLEPFVFFDMKSIIESHYLGAIEETLGSHISQESLEALSAEEAFEVSFEEGDELFEIKYNSLDGVGVNVGNGNRFTSVPRLELESWRNVLPHRITGPNSDSCLNCHSFPVGDGAGVVNDNTIRIDPERLQSGFIERQSPHVHGMGAQQLLAEEMTTDLQALRDAAIDASCASGESRDVDLVSKAVSFGSLDVDCTTIDYSGLEGVDQSLIIKPFEWKGLTASVRDFARGAAHQELGMQAVELVGDVDADFDGVTSEFTVGDITALTVYLAAQPRPTTKIELNEVMDQLPEEAIDMYGLPLSRADIRSIRRGERLFARMDCTQCHTPALTVSSPTFYEPSNHTAYRDEVFPAGEGVRMPQVALQFDITADQPNNQQILSSGKTLGAFETNDAGEAIVRLYGDLKRHDMGSALDEVFDEGNVGSSMYITETLWGVGSTPPYLHDGRATTLVEAILHHGGEAEESKEAFVEASTSNQADLLAFLDNLVIFLD